MRRLLLFDEDDPNGSERAHLGVRVPAVEVQLPALGSASIHVVADLYARLGPDLEDLAFWTAAARRRLVVHARDHGFIDTDHGRLVVGTLGDVHLESPAVVRLPERTP